MAPLLTRLALIGLAVVLFIFADHASATFDFPRCVKKCMGKTDVCPKLRPKCVCQTEDKFLSAVLDCMASQCPDDLRDADDSFIGIMEKGCKVARRPLDDKILERAEEYANKLYTNKFQPPQATDKPTITDDAPPAKETEKPTPIATTSTESESPTEAASPSTSSEAAQTNDRGPPNTAAVAPNTPPAPTTPPANSEGTSNQGDGSPFDIGGPNRSGASKGQVAGFIASAVLPLAAAILFL
ncbi:hypothetical protein QBC37DRAFT_287300 [Rhypophila decipiens]|uniref:CFEM domain-containing protein n=1 Tax=Rhypophila decipiens TaxID=261697 RepID=A0AAN6Y5F5_9PEZI|nr:hypothetical protein QBC37DRAFT_287300 [Rhypophila decipiens]